MASEDMIKKLTSFDSRPGSLPSLWHTKSSVRDSFTGDLKEEVDFYPDSYKMYGKSLFRPSTKEKVVADQRRWLISCRQKTEVVTMLASEDGQFF